MGFAWITAMKLYEPITLSRDCEAIQIPSGDPIKLPEGTRVRITQSMGGTYTVMTTQGYLARIAEKDADALGEAPAVPPPPAIPEAETATPLEGPELEQRVWEKLKTIYDPEIPVNIVDLGLVYLCQVNALPEGGAKVKVQMTLTAPGCGMGDVLRRDAEQQIRSLPGAKDVDVEIVLDPPWDQSRMSEAARLQLGFFDY
jgi:probable FeS assembly SUF system protein SufT